MKFFNAEKSTGQESLISEKVAISSIIGSGTIFTGNLAFSGKLKLDGKVEGNIKGEHLIIGGSGSVTGDIEAETCTCQGKVCGNIKSQDLNVVKGCRIDGNVITKNLLVESGASLNGEVKVDTKDLRLVQGNVQSMEVEQHRAATPQKTGVK